MIILLFLSSIIIFTTCLFLNHTPILDQRDLEIIQNQYGCYENN
jgi:hypothetical protein